MLFGILIVTIAAKRFVVVGRCDALSEQQENLTLCSLSSPSTQTFRLATARIREYLVFFFFSWLKRGYINK